MLPFIGLIGQLSILLTVSTDCKTHHFPTTSMGWDIADNWFNWSVK